MDLPVYCERDSFGAEPINTLSNASFWIAAAIGWRMWRRRRTAFVTLAASLLVAVGLCSGLWHWFRVAALLPLDSIPLYAFVLIVAYRALALLVTSGYAIGVLAVAVVTALIAHIVTLETTLNVVSRHGAVLFVLCVALWPVRSRAGVAWRWIAAGLALYGSALLAKSLDAAACPHFSIGLHWIWHGLGAAAAGVSVHGVFRIERP